MAPLVFVAKAQKVEMDKLEKAKKERTKVSEGQMSCCKGKRWGFVGPAGGAPRAPAALRPCPHPSSLPGGARSLRGALWRDRPCLLSSLSQLEVTFQLLPFGSLDLVAAFVPPSPP